MFEKSQRIGLMVYLYYNRDARKLAKYGDLVYHSKKMRYLVLYTDKAKSQDLKDELTKLKFVKKVKLSQLDQIDQDFVGNLHRPEKFSENGA